MKLQRYLTNEIPIGDRANKASSAHPLHIGRLEAGIRPLGPDTRNGEIKGIGPHRKKPAENESASTEERPGIGLNPELDCIRGKLRNPLPEALVYKGCFFWHRRK